MQQNIIHTHYYQSPFGELILGVFEEELCLCDWRYRKMRTRIDQRICKGLNAHYEEQFTELHAEVLKQLEAYFSSKRKHFDLPLRFVGTDFQVRVWKALQEIPYGETRSYMQLSELLGDPNAIRAVSTANGANALSLFVPCHRVVGSDGSMKGYAGGNEAKKKLLIHEGAIAQNQLALF